MLKTKDIDMLHGPIFKNIMLYTIPIILTNVLQLLFTAADLVVVGRFCGSDSVAAVGATSSLVNLFVNFFIGISVGAGVSVATALGEKNEESVHKIVHTSIPIAFACGIIITVLGVSFSEFFLKLMDTPKGILPLSAQYMKIYFAGITATMIYNFCASILRAAGDTKSPFIYLSLAGVLNVVLNVVFVTAIELNVAGVALATVISQVLSAILVLITLMKRTDACKFILKKINFHKEPFIKILKIGLPAGIQSSLFSISNVLIQSSVNSFGNASVSGGSAASNIEGFVYVSMNAFHQTTLNFIGQNSGTKNYKRVVKIFKTCLLCVSVSGLILGLGTRLLGKTLLSFYITDSPDAITCGLIKLTFVCAPYFICGLMEVTTGAIRGLGSSLTPMLASVIGVCAFRVVWILTVFKLPKFHTLSGVFVSYPISWILTFLVELVLLFLVLRKKRRSM